MEDTQKTQQQGTGKKTGMAILAYIIFFIPLLTNDKDDPFVKYHVKQGLVLFIYWVVAWIIATMIPIIGWILSPVLNIIGIILLIIGIVRASEGREVPLPVIGKYASKFEF